MKSKKFFGIFSAALGMGIFVTILILMACASAGTVLRFKPVDVNSMLKGPESDERFNVIRFSTFGPHFREQLYCYFLYKDGIEVSQEEGIPFERIGKMSIKEVMTDYQNVLKDHMYTKGSNLIVQAYYRDSAIVGYTAADINIGIRVWDITKEGGTPLLRIVYEDLRLKRESELFRNPRHRK